MNGDWFKHALAGAFFLAVATPIGADGATDPFGPSWQEKRLMQPSSSQRLQEGRGQVFIYDGLEHGTVQRAMDEHFDRIENMMFTRIHHLPPSGAGPAVVEDDGCD
jgi:hypothetical protein